MNGKQELLEHLQQIIGEQLGAQHQYIDQDSTWAELGADSLDRLEMSRVIEDVFRVEIPHEIGERLDTVGKTVDHLWNLIAVRRESSSVRIESATTSQQWAEILSIRTQVFTVEYGLSIQPLPRPDNAAVWHFLARENHDAVGALSIVDTTRDRRIHQRYRLSFGNRDRVARYAQLAILKPYRKRGIFEMLIEAAENTVIRANGFTVGWLLYPAANSRSSVLIRQFGFTAHAPLLSTEFGSCHALVRREPTSLQMKQAEQPLAAVETLPV
jgi:acyl carrier protein